MIPLDRLSSKPALFLYGILSLALAFGVGVWWRDWHRAQAADATPKVAEPTRQARKWKRHREDRAVSVPALSEAEIARLVAKYGAVNVQPASTMAGSGEAPAASATPSSVPAKSVTPLSESSDHRAAPAGVDVLTTLDDRGNIGTVVVPRPEPFFGASLHPRLFAEALTADTQFDRLTTNAGIEVDLLRMGAVHFQPKAEWFRHPLPDGAPRRYDDGWLVGLRISWEPH